MPSTYCDVIQQNYSPSVLSHNKPSVIDEMKFIRATDERTQSTSSNLRSYDGFHRVLPPITFDRKPPVLGELESRIVLECSRDLASFQTQIARFSTERIMSQDTATDNVNLINFTSILPRTTAIPVITPELIVIDLIKIRVLTVWQKYISL